MRRRRIWFPVGALVAAGVALLLFTDIVDIELLSGLPKLRLQRTTVRTASTVELVEVRDLYALTTVAYVHRAVFPYDYLPEGVTIGSVLQKLRGTDLTVRDALSDDEYLFFQTFNLASEIGMGMGTRDTDFVVVTTVVEAGFDLTGTILENPEAATAAERAQFFQVELFELDDGTAARRAIVSLPPAGVTRVAVEDLTSETYAYPDVSIGADGWRLVAEFVEERVLALPAIDELIQTAQQNGERLVETMLKQAGYDQIVIR